MTDLMSNPIIGHPLGGGGDSRQIQRCMGTYTGIWTIILPWRRAKWGRFVFQKPSTAGKTGDFANETGQFQVVLNEEHKDRCAEEHGPPFYSWWPLRWMQKRAQVLLCKCISIVLLPPLPSSDITMADSWLILDFCFLLCKWIPCQKKLSWLRIQ